MERNQMKNIVVLKNLPSNLVEEAIVILKSKKNAKKLEYIDKLDNIENKDNNENKENYIIREAESVITNYINIMEKKDKKENSVEANKKYRNLKIYSIIVTVGLILFMIV